MIAVVAAWIARARAAGEPGVDPDPRLDDPGTAADAVDIGIMADHTA